MSTSVADLVASLRMDTTGFDAPLQQSAGAVGQLATASTAGSAALGVFGDALTSAATVVTGTFVAGLTASINVGMNFNSMIEQSAISLRGFGETAPSVVANIQAIAQSADKLGIPQQQMAKMSQTLQALTQGAENNTSTWTALAGAAATTQVPIAQLSQQLGYLYQAFSQGDTSIGFMGRVLVKEGLIPQSTLDNATAMVKAGTDINQVWKMVMDTLAGGPTTANEFAKSFTGLTNTLKNEFGQASAMAFAPLFDSVKKAEEAFGNLMQSPAFQKFVTTVGQDIAKLIPDFTKLADSVNNLGKNTSLGTLTNDLKQLQPLLGLIGGLGAAGGLGALSGLPVIGTAIAPLAGMINPVVGALVGLIASSKDGRDALLNLAEAGKNLLGALAPIAASFLNLLGASAPLLVSLVNLAAGAINFVASTRPILDILVALGAAYVAFQVWQGAVAVFQNVQASIAGAVNGLRSVGTSAEAAAAQELVQAQSSGLLAESLAAVSTAQAEYAAAVAGSAEAEAQAASIRMRSMDYFAGEAQVTEILTEAETQLTEATLNLSAAQAELANTSTSVAETEASMSIGMTGMLGPIGIAIAAITALVTVFELLHQKQTQSTRDAQQYASTYMQEFSKQNPSSTSDYSQITADLKAAEDQRSRMDALDKARSQQIAADKAQLAQAESAAHSGDPQAIAFAKSLKSEISEMTKEINDSKAASGSLSKFITTGSAEADNALKNINKAMAQTGASMAQVSEAAKKAGIDITLDPGSNRGAENLQSLVKALNDASTGFQSLSNAADTQSITKMSNALDQITVNLKGTKGNASFQMPMDIQGANAQLQAMQGLNVETLQYAQHQLKVFENGQTWSNLNMSLTKSLQGVADAAVNVTKAEVALADAQRNARMATEEQNAATVNMNLALQGHANRNWNLIKTLDELTPAQKAFGDVVTDMVSKSQQLQVAYDNLNNTYTQMTQQLQDLTNQERQFQDILKAPLQGTSKYDTLIQTNKMAQESIQAQVNSLELQGMPTKAQPIVLLTEQLQKLKLQGDQLNLQKSLDIGNKTWELNQLQNTMKEITFTQAKEAATHVGELKQQIDNLTPTVDGMKTQVDRAKFALDLQNRSTDQAVTALSALAQSDQQVRQTSAALTSATESLTRAQQQYRDAVYAVQQAHAAMTRQHLQDNVDMTNSVLQMVAESKAALQDLINSYNQVTQAAQTATQASAGFSAAGALYNASAPAGDLGSQIAQALKIAGAPANWAGAINQIVQHESGGNPKAINLTDSNAAAGHPSQGLMQTIPGTFNQYAMAGYNHSITDPLENLIAGIRYIMSRYGSVFNVPGIMAMSQGRPYVGYAAGGLIDHEQIIRAGESGHELMLPITDAQRSRQLLASHAPNLMNSMNAPPPIMSTSSSSSSSIAIHSGAVQVALAIPGGMSIPPELTEEIHDTVHDALSDILATYAGRR